MNNKWNTKALPFKRGAKGDDKDWLSLKRLIKECASPKTNRERLELANLKARYTIMTGENYAD